MAKILAFIASPRPQGSCAQILERVCKGAKEGKAEVRVYDLNSPNLRGCQGCLYCRTHPECMVKDFLAPVYSEMISATGIVFASPIYFAQVTGQAKIWLDRMFPMLDGPTSKPRFPGKAAVTIFSQGDGNPERFGTAINLVHGFMRTFGWKVSETLINAGASAAGFAISPDLLERAYKAGQELAAWKL